MVCNCKSTRCSEICSCDAKKKPCNINCACKGNPKYCSRSKKRKYSSSEDSSSDERNKKKKIQCNCTGKCATNQCICLKNRQKCTRTCNGCNKKSCDNF